MTALTIAKYTTTIAQMLDSFRRKESDSHRKTLWKDSVVSAEEILKTKGVVPIIFSNPSKGKEYYGLLYDLGNGISAELRFDLNAPSLNAESLKTIIAQVLTEPNKVTKFSKWAAINNGITSGFNKDVSTSILDTIGLDKSRRLASPIELKAIPADGLYVMDFIGSTADLIRRTVDSDFAVGAFNFSNNFSAVFDNENNKWKVTPYPLKK